MVAERRRDAEDGRVLERAADESAQNRRGVDLGPVRSHPSHELRLEVHLHRETDLQPRNFDCCSNSECEQNVKANGLSESVAPKRKSISELEDEWREQRPCHPSGQL